MREDIACLLHLWPGSLLAQLEANYSCRDDCSLARLPSLHHGEYCTAGSHPAGTAARPHSQPHFCHGDRPCPWGSRQRHRHTPGGTGESHTPAVPPRLQPGTICSPERLHLQSALCGTADNMHFSSTAPHAPAHF